MTPQQKKNSLTRLAIAALIVVAFLSVALNCRKIDDVSQRDIEEKITQTASDDRMMNPGPDPQFVGENPSVSGEQEPMSATRRKPTTNVVVNPAPVWERYMYIDRTDTIYSSSSSSRKLGGYLRKYGFNGIYMYGTSGILSSSSNFSAFASFLKTLSDSGVVFRGVASGSATAFQTGGGVSNYNNSRTSLNEKVNRANLELEWWNGTCTWPEWDTINRKVSRATIADNDFYEGWYKNMGSTVDTVAAKSQILHSDRILLHCYQNGIPTYSYANAQSTGATGGRLDIIAKGARQAGRKIDVYIIISAENTAWGASNTFTGPALNNAYLAGQPNAYSYIETQAYNNIFNGMTSFQKQWINLKGFVWFTKRYCYQAVPR